MNQLNNGIFSSTAPLRIPIAGGGTDLPEYYQKHSGFWISLSIDKLVNVVLHKNNMDTFYVHYKNNETCSNIKDIKHPIIRKMLQRFSIEESLSIHSISELQGNSGLGSSSTFALCLAKTLSNLSNEYIECLPDYVYNFERQDLGEFVGKQDVWAAYSGGLKLYECDNYGKMTISNIIGSEDVVNFCDHLLLVRAGKQRFANEILKSQAHNLNVDKSFEDNYHKTKALANEILLKLKSMDIAAYGNLVDQHWQNKMQTFKNNFDPEVFEVYNDLKKEGAIGAKLCGAGNSGYMLAVFNRVDDINQYIKYSGKQCVKVNPYFRGLQ
jgi:D-glycero-alpha-D-manno-heptose-7-phosphate kinase